MHNHVPMLAGRIEIKLGISAVPIDPGLPSRYPMIGRELFDLLSVARPHNEGAENG
jgi:hypothetical protein